MSHEQLRALPALLASDCEAGDRVELLLPGTAVRKRTVAPQGQPSCCLPTVEPEPPASSCCGASVEKRVAEAA